MAHDPMNPFGLPHMGTSMNNPTQNPMLASMEMMRQAMTGLGQSAQTASGTMSSALTPEDLERKISELKVVENWLKLNLSMLSGSIQGLEVQLATVRTLRSFVAMGSAPSASSDGEPSPLEVVLGLKPAPKRAAQQAPAMPPETPPETQTDTKQATPGDSINSGTASADANASTSAAAQAWWKMIEGQFAQLAAATTQANSAAQAAARAATTKATATKPSTASASIAKPAAKKTAASQSVKRPAKTAARKTTKTSSKRTQA